MGSGNWFRAQAINKCTNSNAKCWSLNGMSNYDMSEARKDTNNAKPPEEAIEWADVIHQSDTFPTQFGLDKHPNFVLEFRGGFLRMLSRGFWNYQAKYKIPIITVPELGRFVPRFHYIPIPFDINAMSIPYPEWPEPRHPLKVLQTPSRRDYKDTDVLIEVCNSLDDVELTIIEDQPPSAAIEAKKECDVYFDKFKAGNFGGSSKEALAMGMAVVCRLQPIVRVHNPMCPIINVGNKEDLRNVLSALASNDDFCKLMKEKSRSWASWFLSFESVAPRMEAFYEYVMFGDDQYWWDEHSKIWKQAAKEHYGIEEFWEPMEVRW